MKKSDFEKNKSTLRLHLVQKTDRYNTVPSKSIERNFDCNDATVRNMIHSIRMSGTPIASSKQGNHTGYFMPQHAEDLDETIGHMESLIRGVVEVTKKLKEKQSQMKRRDAPHEAKRDVETEDLFGGE